MFLRCQKAIMRYKAIPYYERIEKRGTIGEMTGATIGLIGSSVVCYQEIKNDPRDMLPKTSMTVLGTGCSTLLGYLVGGLFARYPVSIPILLYPFALAKFAHYQSEY